MYTEKIIKRFLWQKCVGYNGDFTYEYLEGVAEFVDGTTGPVHYINPTSYEGLWKDGPLPYLPARLVKDMVC